MTLELKGVSKVVAGRTHVHPTDLTAREGHDERAARPDAVGQDHADAADGGARRARPTGRILWNGDDVTGMRVQDRKVAMVYQQFINYPSMTVYDNIASPCG
jgi:glycerol transport system ATP-binding protein